MQRYMAAELTEEREATVTVLLRETKLPGIRRTDERRESYIHPVSQRNNGC